MKDDTAEIHLKGISICRGIAVGKLFFLERMECPSVAKTVSPELMETEIGHYHNALAKSRQDIKCLQKRLETESASEAILILDSHLEILQDPIMIKEVETGIQSSQKNAAFVFQETMARYQEKFACHRDPFFNDRSWDIKDISRRVLGYLQGGTHNFLRSIPPHSIVCAEELTASDIVEANLNGVGAFITQNGGATSHAAIVAKAKGIPYITNIPLAMLKEISNAFAIVDGQQGSVIFNPSDETLEHYESLRQKLTEQACRLEKSAQGPATTLDGHSIRLSANIDMTHEVDLVHQYGGHGVGLFRSEYLCLPKNMIPSEDEQFEVYRHLLERMNGLPVVIRTFDLSGDKTSSPPVAGQKNPFLGSRATRFLLREQEVFKTQLRAIMRAAVYGNVSILIPMISTLPELREAKAMMVEIGKQLKIKKKIPIGCMIEVPAAALVADHFAKECDFLSIGTNDLIQFSLAIDRSDQLMNQFYEPADPSIIRLIKLVVTKAKKTGAPVSVCGEIATDPRFTPLLLGLGVNELSVIPRYLPLIKQVIRNTAMADAVKLATKALKLTTAEEILALLPHHHE